MIQDEGKRLNGMILFGLAALTFFMTWAVSSSPLGFAAVEAVVPGAAIPDTTFFYTASGFYAMMERLGTEGLRRYMVMNLVDLLYPLVYGTCFAAWIGFLLPRAKRFPFTVFPFLGFAPSLFDLLENALTRILAFSLPERFTVAANALGYVSCAKFCTFILAVLTIAILGFIKAFGNFAERRRSGND